jgi:flagellar biosynthesis protein FliQ
MVSAMQMEQAVDLGRQAMLTALLLGSPVLAVGLIVAFGIGILQTLTQIQDQTISLVPKIVAMIAALAMLLPWLIARLVEYSQALIGNIPSTIVGG